MIKEPSEKSVDKAIELLKKGISLKELSKHLKESQVRTLEIVSEIKAYGYNVLESNGDLVISRIQLPTANTCHLPWDGESIVRFGLIGDTHLNSKYTQITYLRQAYDIFTDLGIQDVFHTGDLDEGEEMRPGHKYECYSQGHDDHVKEIVKVFPQKDGIKTHFITGNHDASFVKRAGLDIGYSIQKERPDMDYLGPLNALVHLTPNCTLELRHPGGGSSYAISYRGQKMVEAMSGDEKPNILAFGHFHKIEYMFYRNVHVFQTGTLQAQTPFMRGKSIAAHLGFWVVEVHVDKRGTIKRLKQEMIPFYSSIVDDYKTWGKTFKRKAKVE